MEQRSEEWKALKAGKVSGTRVKALMARTKTGYSETREKTLRDVVSELLTGELTEIKVTDAMQWGIDNEQFARSAYESRTGEMVMEIAWVHHPKFVGKAGCSPDGFVSSGNMVEFKCPQKNTHLDYLLKQSLPSEYKPQVQWQMACTGADWCDFVSYHPKYPAHMQLMIVRVNRDDEYIEKMEGEVRKFLGEVQDYLTKLETLYDNR